MATPLQVARMTRTGCAGDGWRWAWQVYGWAEPVAAAAVAAPDRLHTPTHTQTFYFVPPRSGGRTAGTSITVTQAPAVKCDFYLYELSSSVASTPPPRIPLCSRYSVSSCSQISRQK